MDPLFEEARLLEALALGPKEKPKPEPVQFTVEWDRAPVPPEVAARAERRVVTALAKLLGGTEP
jgi:hypothetical protein